MHSIVDQTLSLPQVVVYNIVNISVIALSEER